MERNALQELYVDNLRDIYSAENQLMKALPKMAKGARSQDLRSAFEEHLRQTKEHVARLERIFESMGEGPDGKTCKGMKGLIQEGGEVLKEDFEGEAHDAGLIGAAQRVEHYEIAAYGTVRTYANVLGDSEAASLLETTLEEEKQTDQKLTALAENINLEAAETEPSSESEEPKHTRSRGASSRG